MRHISLMFINVCSSVVEDCEDAFVKNPEGHPLVLYLRTEEDHNLTGATRQLLERVNAADKAAKIKVGVCRILNEQVKQVTGRRNFTVLKVR